MKRHQRFVEFYDVRDAAKALSEMNHKEINSKKILIQYSRPGGCGARFPKLTHNPNPKFHTRPSRFFQPPPPPFQRKASPLSAGSPAPRCSVTWSSKKSSQSIGNPGGSIEDSMDSLCISGNGFNKNKLGTDNSCGGSSSSSSSSSKQYGKTNRRTWKGGNSNVMKLKQAKDDDPRFLINEDAIMESDCKDSRTTVMIKNIPNKYRFGLK